MKHPLLPLALLLLAGLGGFPCLRGAERSSLELTTGWLFHRGAAAQAEQPAHNDTDWNPVDLPHTWNAGDGADGGGYFQGEGWYRCRFELPRGWTERRIFLQFDGANRRAEVFLNGRRLGAHRGGYARFCFDATEALSSSGKNLLAVRVDNRADDNMAPVSGDFTFFGGLHRGVRIVATDPIHVELLDHGATGVYVRPTTVSAERAELDWQVKLANDSALATEVTVRMTLLDEAGNTVQCTEARTTLAPLGRGETRTRLVVPQPRLWDAQADPYLYRTRTEVVAANEVRDTMTLPLGLRFFSVDPARGFLLNGRYLDLRGVNRHQDRPRKGLAVDEDDEREDFALIQELGATMIRQSHYQQSQFWNDLGDRHGMVMWAELAYVNEVRDNRTFFENAKEQLRELIRQNLHHPSILFWSIGNETFVRDPKAMPADANDRLLRELAAVVREEDPSRLSTYASNGGVSEPRAGAVDVIGFNHYFGWYHGAPSGFADWADSQHASRPDLCLGISEYGAGANTGHHEEPAVRPATDGQWHPEEWQSHYHEIHWQAMARRPWLWCKLIWCMFDFASDGRNEGATPGINDKGIVTADRKTRKDSFFWYKANWSTEPVLHLASRRFTERSHPVTPVKVYSNAAAVELRVNGISLGSRPVVDRIARWPEVTLREGANAIEVQATVGQRELVDRCTWTLRLAPEDQ